MRRPHISNGSEGASDRIVPNLSAFLFDMDGVIVDSNPQHRLAWEAFNRRYGLETTEAMHQLYVRPPQRSDCARIFSASELSEDEVAARGFAKEALYREMIGGSRREHDRSRVCAIFSIGIARSPRPSPPMPNPPMSIFLLDRAGLRPYFRAVVDGHQVSPSQSPFPDIFLRAAELLGVPPAECLVFEDSHSGVEAGLAAGMTDYWAAYYRSQLARSRTNHR